MNLADTAVDQIANRKQLMFRVKKKLYLYMLKAVGCSIMRLQIYKAMRVCVYLQIPLYVLVRGTGGGQSSMVLTFKSLGGSLMRDLAQ